MRKIHHGLFRRRARRGSGCFQHVDMAFPGLQLRLPDVQSVSLRLEVDRYEHFADECEL
jgi:hypothetical protein